jgi:hypothetical protein
MQDNNNRNKRNKTMEEVINKDNDDYDDNDNNNTINNNSSSMSTSLVNNTINVKKVAPILPVYELSMVGAYFHETGPHHYVVGVFDSSFAAHRAGATFEVAQFLLSNSEIIFNPTDTNCQVTQYYNFAQTMTEQIADDPRSLSKWRQTFYQFPNKIWQIYKTKLTNRHFETYEYRVKEYDLKSITYANELCSKAISMVSKQEFSRYDLQDALRKNEWE